MLYPNMIIHHFVAHLLIHCLRHDFHPLIFSDAVKNIKKYRHMYIHQKLEDKKLHKI